MTVKGGYIAQINAMIADISQLGVVEQREGPMDDPEFPPEMGVEDSIEHERTEIAFIGRAETVVDRLVGRA